MILEPRFRVEFLARNSLRDIPMLHEARSLEPQLVHNNLVEISFNKLSEVHMAEAPSCIGCQVRDCEAWGVDEHFEK